MILDKKILIGLCGRNVNRFELLGYKIPRQIDSRGRLGWTKGTKIKVKIEDLCIRSSIKVRVECEICGKIRKVSIDTLLNRSNSSYNKNRETLCSNCANHKMSGINSGQYKHGNNRFCEYRCSAKKRGLEFKLTVKQFEKLTQQACYYCGGFSSNYVSNSRGNGIDRKNNKQGYIFSNCLSCCFRCNFFKNKMEYTEFIEHIKKIYKRIFKNEI